MTQNPLMLAAAHTLRGGLKVRDLGRTFQKKADSVAFRLSRGTDDYFGLSSFDLISGFIVLRPLTVWFHLIPLALLDWALTRRSDRRGALDRADWDSLRRAREANHPETYQPKLRKHRLVLWFTRRMAESWRTMGLPAPADGLPKEPGITGIKDWKN